MVGVTVERKRGCLAFLVVLTIFLIGQPPVHAKEAAPKHSWAQRKCQLYASDWSQTLKRMGSDGVSREFLGGNAAFIARGCGGGDKICPSSAKDWKLVDVLAILVVDQGMSTTFLPFPCQR